MIGLFMKGSIGRKWVNDGRIIYMVFYSYHCVKRLARTELHVKIVNHFIKSSIKFMKSFFFYSWFISVNVWEGCSVVVLDHHLANSNLHAPHNVVVIVVSPKNHQVYLLRYLCIEILIKINNEQKLLRYW